MRVWKIGIIGGGPGGLMTAYHLQKATDAAFRVTLFEASPRLGGKILTPRFATAPVRYEAGAAEFYDYSHFDDDPLKELIAELGLAVRPMGGSAVITNHRVLANLDDVRTHLGPAACRALLEFDRRAKDRTTPQEFYHSDSPEGGGRRVRLGEFAEHMNRVRSEPAHRYVRCLIHSDLAAEHHQTGLDYGLHNYLMNDPAYLRLYGIVDGNDRLPAELAARIAGDKLLEHRVTTVRREGRRYIVTAERAGARSEHEFDFLVVALPHNQLASVRYEGRRLHDAMRAHHAHYDHPAHYLRITMLFDRPFWRNVLSDSYWMLDAFGGCCLYDESSRIVECRHGVLGWLLGGDVALEKSSLSDEALIREALDSLPPMLAHGRRHFLEARIHRWTGAVSALPGGLVAKKLDRRHQPEPIEHPGLFVVGDYLFDSTLNGVLDSAQYVAGWLASEMEHQGRNVNDCETEVVDRQRRRSNRRRPAAGPSDGNHALADQLCVSSGGDRLASR